MVNLTVGCYGQDFELPHQTQSRAFFSAMGLAHCGRIISLINISNFAAHPPNTQLVTPSLECIISLSYLDIHVEHSLLKNDLNLN